MSDFQAHPGAAAARAQLLRCHQDSTLHHDDSVEQSRAALSAVAVHKDLMPESDQLHHGVGEHIQDFYVRQHRGILDGPEEVEDRVRVGWDVRVQRPIEIDNDIDLSIKNRLPVGPPREPHFDTVDL
jgi:hypothetical protein